MEICLYLIQITIDESKLVMSPKNSEACFGKQEKFFTDFIHLFVSIYLLIRPCCFCIMHQMYPGDTSQFELV